jgi:hypothetical protein
MPVAHGWCDHGLDDGVTVATRVFFPSTDESPADARILLDRGPYPLVLLVHDPEEEGAVHRWTGLPGQLARCGYVVAVPDVHALTGGPAADAAQRLREVAEWMRAAWPHHRVLAPPDVTGVVGHRGGALLAARFAARTAGASPSPTVRARHAIARALGRPTDRAPIRVSAFASLGGPWRARPDAGRPLAEIRAATLFVRGSEDDAAVDELWPALPAPKHDTLIDGMTRTDYLDGDEDRFALQTLGYDEIFATKPPYSTVVADVVTMFLDAYLPPRAPAHRRSNHLVPPPLRLNREQRLFAKGHLAGITRLTRAGGRIQLRHETRRSSGIVTLP